MKVCIIAGNQQYVLFFKKLGYEIVYDVADSDLVCFTGGEDVTPSLYGCYQHDQTWNNPARDKQEQAIFNQCIDLHKPMVGICRGGQFLNVMSGGSMYQHVTGHTRSHMLVDHDSGFKVLVSSTHHQMMKPSDKAIIIATSVGIDSYREWYDGHVPMQDFNEDGVEVVYYQNTNALCFQPHPEFSVVEGDYKDMANYFEECLEDYLGLLAIN